MLNNSTDDIDNNEVISINNIVTTTGIIFCLPFSNTLNWLHGTVLSNIFGKNAWQTTQHNKSWKNTW